MNAPCVVLPQNARRVRIVRTNDAALPASAVLDPDGFTLTYRPDATVEQMQAALDGIGVGYIVTQVSPLEWDAKPTGRRPGPPPRQETKRERNERWRKECAR